MKTSISEAIQIIFCFPNLGQPPFYIQYYHSSINIFVVILISYAAVLKRSAKKKLESLYAKRKQREHAQMLNLPNFDNSDLQSQITVSDRISDMVRKICSPP